MDIDMEKRIAKAFIYPNKQERFLFELSKKYKDNSGARIRQDAIFKLERIIDKTYTLMESRKFPEASRYHKDYENLWSN